MSDKTGWTKWTEEEDGIIAECYPTMGDEGTHARLRELGYDRTVLAVKMRASNLGVKRTVRKPARDAWTDEEIAVLADVYPTYGADMVSAALAKRGYDRTPQSVRVRATMLGIKSTARRSVGGDNVQYNFVLSRSLDAAIIDKLKTVKNRSEYIRGLIRKDMGGK